MSIRVCVAGATGWTGSAVVRAILASEAFELAGAVGRRLAGQDAGEALGLPRAGVVISSTLGEALRLPVDVLIDYTGPDSVKGRTLEALARGVRVVVGTSGLSAADYAEIGQAATERGLGVIAAGNFSITAALAKHFALIAARYLPSWEIVDYARRGQGGRAERDRASWPRRWAKSGGASWPCPSSRRSARGTPEAPQSRAARSTRCACPGTSSRSKPCSACPTSA